jgi:hypothetical protein
MLLLLLLSRLRMLLLLLLLLPPYSASLCSVASVAVLLPSCWCCSAALVLCFARPACHHWRQCDRGRESNG